MRWIDPLNTPILNHPLDQPSAFTASNLIDNVRRARRVPEAAVPPLCVLEFDGDLTGWLIREGTAKPFPAWPCFHTAMFAIECEGVRCSIIPRTIGGPYAVLIAEQLAAAGTELIVGLHPLAASLAIFPFPVLSSPPARFATKERPFTICHPAAMLSATQQLCRC